MFTIAVVLFLSCLAQCLYSVFRLHQKPTKRERAWLAGSGVGVLVFGAAAAIIFAQVGLIKRQEQFLQAALDAFASARQQVAIYDAKGNAVTIPCSKGIAAAHDFNADYAMAPTWSKAPIYDHANVAILSYSLYKMLEAKACVSSTQVDSTLALLRTMQSADDNSPSLAARFLVAVPIGLLPKSLSMRAMSAITWAHLSPHAIAVQNCYETIMRTQQHTLTQPQTDACEAPTPHVIPT